MLQIAASFVLVSKHVLLWGIVRYHSYLKVTLCNAKTQHSKHMVHNALEHSHCGVNFTREDSDQLEHVKEMQIIQNERDGGRR